MKLGITGLRSFDDYSLLAQIVGQLNPAEIITGGAKGTDSCAEKYAKSHNLNLTIYLPRFKTDPSTKYHPRWYLERNKTIVDNADCILAFWDGKSRGTGFTVNYARKTRRPMIVVHIDKSKLKSPISTSVNTPNEASPAVLSSNTSPTRT